MKSTSCDASFMPMVTQNGIAGQVFLQKKDVGIHCFFGLENRRKAVLYDRFDRWCAVQCMMTMDHGLLLLFHVSLLRLSFLCCYFKRMILYFLPRDEDGALLIFLHQTKFFLHQRSPRYRTEKRLPETATA